MSQSRSECISVPGILRTCRERAEEDIRTSSDRGIRIGGFLCNAFPPELLAGLGIRPLRLECGASSQAESAGENIVRADVCPLVKSLLGNVVSRTGMHSHVDIWIGLLTCDQMRRAMFSLQDDLGLEMHPVQMPAIRTEEALAYYRDQLIRLISNIGRLHGLTFDPDAAIKWRKEAGAASRVLADAVWSMKVSPLTLHEMFHLYFVSQPDGLAEVFREAIARSDFQGRKRVVITGSPIAYEDTSVLEELEVRGISVIPLNCTGLSAVEHDAGQVAPVNSTDGLVDSMAREAFMRHRCARIRPNTGMYEILKKAIAETNADGVILKCLKFCDTWHTERVRMSRELGIPVLVLDSVYAQGEDERLRSRVDAFIETM